ncbi:MAG: MFS transporter [Pseudomonadota bacterium]
MTTDEARRGRWAVAAMFAANGMTMGAWAPQIPELLPRHGIDESTLGLLILGLGIGAVGAMLFAGRLIARYGSVPMVKLFASLGVLTLPLIVFAPNLWTLAPAMAFFGGILGVMDVSMNSNAVEIERRLGRAIMSSSHGFWSLGGFVGGSAGSWLLVQTSREAQALAASGAFIVLLALAWRFLKGEAAQPMPGADAPRTRLLPRVWGLWLLGAMALFSMVPEGSVLDWGALYIREELGGDAFRAGLGFAFFAGAMALMRFLGDGVRNRFGAVTTLRVSGLLGMAGLLVAAMASTPWLVIVGFTLCGLGVANMIPVIFSAAGNYPGLPPGAGISAVSMVGYAGILIAPASIGFVAEQMGYRPTYITLGLVLAVISGLAPVCARADAIAAAPARAPR